MLSINTQKIYIFLYSVIILAGTLLRWFNLSPYKIFPETYANLLVAENIRNWGSVGGHSEQMV